MLKLPVAVFVSGGGTNLQAILDAEKTGVISSGKVELVISSSPDAYALERAKKAGVDSAVVSKKEYGCLEKVEEKIETLLNKYQIGLIVLAGYMSILSEKFTKKYSGRIINIHPSLIPAFCGKGYYGLKVHEAAIDRGVKLTGATVHYVNEIPDGGEIIEQKCVLVKEGDTPEILQKRVMEEAEWIIFPRAVESVCEKLLSEAEE